MFEYVFNSKLVWDFEVLHVDLGSRKKNLIAIKASPPPPQAYWPPELFLVLK